MARTASRVGRAGVAGRESHAPRASAPRVSVPARSHATGRRGLVSTGTGAGAVGVGAAGGVSGPATSAASSSRLARRDSHHASNSARYA
jgi:hypothetical protein